MPDVDPVREPDAHQVLRFFGWGSPFLLLTAYLAGVLLRDATPPENRNPDDLIVVPLLLGVLSVAFAVPAVLLTVAALARRERLGARELVPAAWSALVLFGLGGWVLVVAAG